jgi:hypothetical protein
MATKCTELTKDWTDVPHKHQSASPSEFRYVVDVAVIRLKNGHLRGSDFDGIFELADVTLPVNVLGGKLKAEVKVGWFGRRPLKTWAHITLRDDWELLKNYSGLVTHNISAKKKT